MLTSKTILKTHLDRSVTAATYLFTFIQHDTMEPTPTSELPPPPPYEEVVGASSDTALQAAAADSNGDMIQVTVANPHKQSDGYTTFITYKVTTVMFDC